MGSQDLASTLADAGIVDPDLLPLVRLVPGLELDRSLLPAVREDLVARVVAAQADESLPVNSRRTRVPHPGCPEGVRIFIYEPQNDTQVRAAILHIHGGGYILGSPLTSASENQMLAHRIGATVVSVDYRLAPEHPYPAALDDCFAVLTWLQDNSETLGIDPTRIIIKGESAGGGLAAALTLLARDRGVVTPSFQHLTYPMLDDRTCARTDLPRLAGRFVWTREQNRFAWECYLPSEPGSPELPAYAAPARAADLSGLPPTYIAVGALDLFLEENLEYARRLVSSEVPVELHVYPRAFHSFIGLPNESAVAATARQRSWDALEEACRPPVNDPTKHGHAGRP